MDHFTGVDLPDFRICSGLVNGAKGALPHNQFIDLCRLVVAWENEVAAAGLAGRANAGRTVAVRRGECQPTAPSPLNRATSSGAKPSSSSTASVSVPAGRVARGVPAGVAE